MKRDKQTNLQALKALQCDHETIGYTEFGWDSFRNCPTGIHGICRGCGMEIEPNPQCNNWVMNPITANRLQCLNQATRVIDGKPQCGSCDYEDKTMTLDQSQYWNIPPEAKEPDDDYRGVEYG